MMRNSDLSKLPFDDDVHQPFLNIRSYVEVVGASNPLSKKYQKLDFFLDLDYVIYFLKKHLHD